jgi:hypothetical protein
MFAGKTFVFLAAKQQKSMERLVKLTGGSSLTAFSTMSDDWWRRLNQFLVVFPPDITGNAELQQTRAQLIQLGCK